MALAGGPGPVGKDVTQMAATAGADLLDPDHAVTAVADPPDVRLVEGLEKARPARARVEFGIRAEQRQPAEPAGVDAGFLVVEKDAAKRRLGAVLQQDASFVPGQARGDLPALRLGGRGHVECGHGIS
jgi:hypothetical protein